MVKADGFFSSFAGMKDSAILFLKGVAMGAANVIPGVSGGTIALITGIYEKLIYSIKSIDLDTIKLVFQGKIAEAWKHVNGTFLLAIFAGIGVSIITLAKLFKMLLENEVHAIWLMAFFFGLILVSIYSVGRTVSKWSFQTIAALIIGLAAAVSLALLSPANENADLWYLFLCGVIAMCSMILPGLSGSFVLIILGNYKLVMLDAVSDFNLSILIPVGIGAVIALVAFSRFLSWLFDNYKDTTISLLTGFILGSLMIIWPWKNDVYVVDAETGEYVLKAGKKIIGGYDWYLPDFADSNTLIAIAIAVAGGVLLLLMEKLAVQPEKQ